MDHHYNCEIKQTLPLNAIILTSAIVNAIHDNGGHIGDGFKINKLSKKFHDLPLNKDIQKKKESMKDGNFFPPINVCIFPYSDKYIILDGRHRFVASFLLEYTEIPVNIITLCHIEDGCPPTKKLKR